MTLSTKNRRSHARIRLQVPFFIRGRDGSGAEFLELSKSLDISAKGASLACSRIVHAGEILTLTVPAPPVSAAGLFPESTAPLQACVRRFQSAGEIHLLGVEFLQSLKS
ncbi:MAG: PilZ domain-containing protein [Candidatus Acidiferrales bacterium]